MFSIYILSIFLFTHRVGGAAPVYCTQSPSSNATSRRWDSGTLAVIDPTNQRQPPRTLFGVAWSCILTVFICAWTSVHPNVPPRGLMAGLLARFKLMFWVIVAPELVLAWAVRQWFAAREIRDVYNRYMENQPLKLWTMAHGHFLEMGGFTLVSDTIHQFKEPEQPRPMDKSGWLAGVLISLGWGSNNASSTQPKYVTQRDEYVRQRERCHLGALTFERFKELVCDDNFDFPAITSAEINDRSKGDGLSKLLAILQTSWFILQCIARVFQGLALTELELVTLAMASLNAITYAFWWSKPLSVREPVNVYVTERAGVVAETVNRNIDDEDVVYYTARDVTNVRLTPIESEDWCCALCLLPISLIFSITYPVFCLFPLGILFLLRIIKTKNVKKPQDDETVATRVVYTIRKSRYNLTHSIREYFGGREGPLEALQGSDDLSFTMQWFFVMPAYLFLLLLLLTILSPLFAIFFIASLIFTAAFKIVTTNRVPPGATHVPPFYAPRTNSDKYSRMIVFAVFGLIFGGIHCIAWDFAFPTDFERSLWRYTSLVLTAIPVVAAPIDCILENVNLNGRVGKMLRLLLGILMTALLFIYVPARLCLISQALALLRKQPDTVYVSVNWTKYIPHLFM